MGGRDPGVLAVHALRLTAAEFADVTAGRPVRRPFWPPQRCQGAVVGLAVAGLVVGEARVDARSHPEGGAAWAFGPVRRYLRALPVEPGRGMAAPMPPAPWGTATPFRGLDAGAAPA